MASHLRAVQSPPDEADSKYYRILLDAINRTKDVFSIEKAVEPLSSEKILTTVEYKKVIDIIKCPNKKPVRDHLEQKIQDNAELRDMYTLEKALALWIYTLQDPPVYERVSSYMNGSKAARQTATGELTAAVKACLVYIKFVDRALAGLAGAGFLVDAPLWRGMPFKNWEHGAQIKFMPNHSFHWFEMKSTSIKKDVAACDFGGNKGTMFRIKPIEAYNIKLFSSVPGEEEVVLRPLSFFRVDVDSPHHKNAGATPVEIHLTQEHSMRYAVMYGDLGTGKTTLFQTATDSFTVGNVSSGLESVIGYNEAQTKDGKFIIRDVPGKGAIQEQGEHIELQLRGLSEPNHALICVIENKERADLIVNDIMDLLSLFKHKPGIAFLLTKCDKIAKYRRNPEKWEDEMRAAILSDEKTRGQVKSTQLLFTSDMDPECDDKVDVDDQADVIQWQRRLMARWQDKLCDFIEANAQTRPEIYVNLDLSPKGRDEVNKFINTTCGKGPWYKIFEDLKKKLRGKFREKVQALEELGARPSVQKQLYEFEAKVLDCANQFAVLVAAIKDEAAGHTREHSCNPAVMCLLNDCWQEAFEVERLLRQECYDKLPYNPSDASDDNNKFRKCPVCKTIWMKANGCTGKTNCGARVFEKDNTLSLASCAVMAFPVLKTLVSPSYVKGSYMSSVPAQDAKHKQKLEQGKKNGHIAQFYSSPGCGVAVGCGHEFDWGLQPRLPEAEIQAFLVTVDNVHDSSKMVQEAQEDVINKVRENNNQRAANEGYGATEEPAQ